MKRLSLLLFSFVLCCVWVGVAGCSSHEPPKKTTIEKLNSDNLDEQKEGLEEANQKYGGGA